MLIVKTLAGDVIGRARNWEGACYKASNRVEDHCECSRPADGDWQIEDVYEDDGYTIPIEFMTLNGKRFFIVEGVK